MTTPLTWSDDRAEELAHTKIVATIGPASDGRIGELVDAGMSVARLNFSHGTPEDHRRRVALVREVAQAKGTPIGVLTDIRGPKLRLGCFEGGELELARGDRVRLGEGDGVSAEGEVRFDFAGILGSLEVGHRVFLADGSVELVVESVGAEGPVARVRRGGSIGDRQGVHLPDTPVFVEVPTPQDVQDLALARELEIDLIGVSFVSSREELDRVRELAPDSQIVAKIERRAALDDLGGILDACDGVMVARGDLGVEVDLAQLPLVQKTILAEALRAGRFTITATEMLESMVESSRPTRAEVADVANAVLDGTDALMLSAETAVGRYPVESVATMQRVARAVEESQRYQDLPRVGFRASEPTFANATAMAAAEAAEALGIRRIVCFTETGNTVRLLSRYRPGAEIVALSPHRRTLRAMTVLAHVRPLLFEHEPSFESMLSAASETLLERGWASPGEEIVFVAGVPPKQARSTNLMKLHRIGEDLTLH